MLGHQPLGAPRLAPKFEESFPNLSEMSIAAFSVLLHLATALLVPLPDLTIADMRVATQPAAGGGIAFSTTSVFPADVSMLLAEETMSPAKAKIEAAKRAALEKQAVRGYGALAEPVAVAAAPAPLERPKTFAELLEASVKQKEALGGKLTEKEYDALAARVRAAYPGIQ